MSQAYMAGGREVVQHHGAHAYGAHHAHAHWGVYIAFGVLALIVTILSSQPAVVDSLTRFFK